MDQNTPDQNGSAPQPSGSFGNVPQSSEGFRTVPNGSEPFRIIRKDSESFRNIPHPSERKENHSLTVREAARMFEVAGVARTERSIINWCQPNKTGIARLDSYFDPNERKYFITPQSIEFAIEEEKARATKNNEVPEPVRKVPKDSERNPSSGLPGSEGNVGRLRELEMEVMDLKITNRGKDFFIDQLQKERNGVLDQLLNASRKVGELENKLLQLKPPDVL